MSYEEKTLRYQIHDGRFGSINRSPYKPGITS